MTVAWMCKGGSVFGVCETLYRNEGDTNDEETWSCIDEPKVAKEDEA
jgi:hypothetical protein